MHRYSFSFWYQSILKLNKMDRFLHQDCLEVTNERAIIKQESCLYLSIFLRSLKPWEKGIFADATSDKMEKNKRNSDWFIAWKENVNERPFSECRSRKTPNLGTRVWHGVTLSGKVSKRSLCCADVTFLCVCYNIFIFIGNDIFESRLSTRANWKKEDTRATAERILRAIKKRPIIFSIYQM